MGFIMIRQPLVSVDTLRTLALLHKIADAWGVPESGNPKRWYMFREAFNERLAKQWGYARKEDCPTLERGNAWKPYFYGERALSYEDARSKNRLTLLDSLYHGAYELYRFGPAELWFSLFGNGIELRLCIGDDYSNYSDYQQVISDMLHKLHHGDLNDGDGYVSYLSKSVAFYRAMMEINLILPVFTDLSEIRNCIVHCLEDSFVLDELYSLGVIEHINHMFEPMVGHILTGPA